METNFNIGSLKIVSNPLMEYFKKIQNNLNDNIQLVTDKKVPFNFESIDILKKVNGTLKMIGLIGVNKVLSTVSDSLVLIKEAKFDTEKILSVLEMSSKIVSSVVFYLENLLKGENDQPIKFFDDYSILCKLINKEANVKDLFSPRLEFSPNTNIELQADLKVGAFINAGNKEKLVEVLSKNHAEVVSVVAELIDSLKNKSYVSDKEVYQGHIKTLYSVLDMTQKLNLSKNIYITTGLQKLFVAIISPIFNDNFNELVQLSLEEIILNVNKIEQSLKSLLDSISSMDESEKTGTLKVNEEVVREVLFFVINVLNKSNNAFLTQMPVYKELGEFFNFESYSEQLNQTTVEVSLAQRSPETASQIDKLFVEVKEELSLLTSKQAANQEFVQQHATKFVNVIGKMCDLMNPVITPKLKELIQLVSASINSVKNKELQLSEVLQKEISLSLVLIEYGISNFVRSIATNAQKEGFETQAEIQVVRLNLAKQNKEAELAVAPMPVLDAGSQKSDERKAFLVIFEKLHKDLKKSEEILNDLFRDNSNTEDLDQVFKTLNSAKGIFSIINKNELSKILSGIISIWKKVGADGFSSVDSNELSQSVSLLSGILLFIEASKNDNEVEANEMYERIINKVKPEQEVVSYKPLNLPSDMLEEVQEPESVVLVEEEKVLEESFEFNEVPQEVTVEEHQELAIDDLFADDSVQSPQTVGTASFVDQSDDADLTEVYLMEAEEVLENVSLSTNVLKNNLNSNDEITNLRRYYHTLKGSGRMVGLNYLGEVAWMIEQTLNKVLNGDLTMNQEMVQELINNKNQFDSWVEELKSTNSVAVDLVKHKKIWLAHNSNLTNQIEIPDTQAEIVEDNEVFVEKETNLSFDTPIEFSYEQVNSNELADLDNIQEPQGENELNFDLNDDKAQEDKKDTIVINNAEVSLSLFELFKEESEIHISELKNATENHNIENNFVVTKDFMRHAHTLSSIGRSVNMDVFADLVGQVEAIANIALDKKLSLRANEFKIIKEAIQNLDFFANVIDDSLASNEHYKEAYSSLDELLNKLTNIPEDVEEDLAVLEKEFEAHSDLVEFEIKDIEQDEVDQGYVEEILQTEPQQAIEFEQAPVEKNFVEQNPVQQASVQQAPVDINELVAAISQNIAQLFKSNLDDLKGSLESVKSEVNSIKDSVREDMSVANESRQEIDVDSLINSINAKVINAVTDQYDKLNTVLKAKENAEKEKTDDLVNKISILTNELEVLNKSQENIKKIQSENHEAIKKDLRYLNYVIKKKPNLSGKEVVQQENEQGNNEKIELLEIDQVESLENPTDLDVKNDFIENEDFSQLDESNVEQVIASLAQQNIDFSEEEVKEFSNLDDLPSDIQEAEKIKSINDNLSTVKASNSIVEFLNNNEYVKTIFEEKVSIVEDEIDEEIFEISQMETEEILENVSTIMDSINEDSLNLEQNQELKRLLHTLKGSVRMAGANKVGAIAHRLESLLDYSESRHISLFKMKDLLTDELQKVSYLLENKGQELNKEKIKWIDANYDIEDTVDVANEVIESVDEVKTLTPVLVKREEKQYIRIGANLIDGLINEAGEVRLTRTTLEGMLAGNRRSLIDLRSSSDKLGKMLKEIEVQAESQISARSEHSNEKDFDPLEFDRFTRLQELTRFMNEAVSDVQETVSAMETFLKTQDGAVVQQAILTNNLLDTLMKVRLLPVDNISDRLYKITRNTAKELGKKVNLELFGEKTEMDRLVLDKIVSPLEHLLRNCIAHGIEEPNERIAKGKSVLGKVVIKTSVDGNFIVMNIKDDGAGINVEKVRSVGLKKGLLNYNSDYTEQQIIELIFNSGFSTADSISQVSGRGVGMDVVKKEISELGGSIEIKTQKDNGTEFNIVLPVAVATNQAMLTKIADKLVAIPALIVDEVSSLKKDKMQSAYMSGQVELKGKNYPLYYLGHMLGLTPVSQLPELKVYNTLISVTYLGETVVVHVDELQTTSEILIKSMGVHFGKISGVLGATLLGDGRQGLVINPVMLKNHYEQNIKKLNIFHEGAKETTQKMTGVLTVMVVDDSITVRRATSKVLERYGYNIVLAKDGEDGLEQLQVVIPDIILSDIEMPRMDGFEFAKNVKNTEKYSHIPIVMITSRTADKHKNYAYSLGVDGFLGKPYREEELIETIKKLVGTIH